MIQNDIDAVIFDYGGVLINIDYDATIEAFKNLGIENFEKMYSQAEQSNLFNNIETGQIAPTYFINQLLDYLPSGTSANKVVEAWNAMIKNVPASSIELIEDLKKQGLKVYLLSNTNQLHIDVANREWAKVSTKKPVELFDAVYYSHEVKMRKPHKEIFEFVCEENNLDASKTLFIDDSIQHIEGAKSIGLKTIHLSNGLTVQDVFS